MRSNYKLHWLKLFTEKIQFVDFFFLIYRKFNNNTLGPHWIKNAEILHRNHTNTFHSHWSSHSCESAGGEQLLLQYASTAWQHVGILACVQCNFSPVLRAVKLTYCSTFCVWLLTVRWFGSSHTGRGRDSKIESWRQSLACSSESHYSSRAVIQWQINPVVGHENTEHISTVIKVYDGGVTRKVGSAAGQSRQQSWDPEPPGAAESPTCTVCVSWYVVIWL